MGGGNSISEGRKVENMLNLNKDAAEEFDEPTYYQKTDYGLCRLEGDIIVNPKKVSLIRKLDGKTLIYRPGVADPDILPAKAYDELLELLFTDDDDFEFAGDDDEFDDDGDNGDDE